MWCQVHSKQQLHMMRTQKTLRLLVFLVQNCCSSSAKLSENVLISREVSCDKLGVKNLEQSGPSGKNVLWRVGAVSFKV